MPVEGDYRLDRQQQESAGWQMNADPQHREQHPRLRAKDRHKGCPPCPFANVASGMACWTTLKASWCEVSASPSSSAGPSGCCLTGVDGASGVGRFEDALATTDGALQVGTSTRVARTWWSGRLWDRAAAGEGSHSSSRECARKRPRSAAATNPLRIPAQSAQRDQHSRLPELLVDMDAGQVILVVASYGEPDTR